MQSLPQHPSVLRGVLDSYRFSMPRSVHLRRDLRRLSPVLLRRACSLLLLCSTTPAHPVTAIQVLRRRSLNRQELLIQQQHSQI
jgi:hypothetical protein